MMTISMPRDDVYASVDKRRSQWRSDEFVIERRCNILLSMLSYVGPDVQISVDEELFEFLEM